MTPNASWIQDKLLADGPPLIIDGGMGTQLQHDGVPMDGKVWSARAVLSHPEAVRQAHESFIEAGAELIIANTFAAGRHMLEPGGLGDRVGDINRDAVKLAEEARDRIAQGPVAIAGSICEWVPLNDPQWSTAEAIGRSVREQAGYLAEAGVDLIALEMCERLELSVAATEAAAEFGLPLWLGLSAQSYKDHDVLSVFDYADIGFEPLVQGLAEHPAMIMNVMHTPVPDVDEALRIVDRYWDGPVGVYPESGYFTLPDWQFVDIIEPEALAEAAQAWVGKGVSMIGGCCGLGPEHVAALREALT